jgi:hypothetical protein
MYEKNQLNEAYASQGSPTVGLLSTLVISTGAQRDLQEHYMGQTPSEKTVLTTSALLAFSRKTINISGCLNGLTTPFESYCAANVKATVT